MSKYDDPFVEHVSQTPPPKWNSKAPVVPLVPAWTAHMRNTPQYYSTPNRNAGDFYDYDGYIERDEHGEYRWADVGNSFWAVLKPERFEGGRSAANVRLRDTGRPDKSYLMVASDYFSAMQNSSLPYGQVKGEFAFVKKGSNWRIKLLTQES